VTKRPRIVLKLGGELLERAEDVSLVARAIADLSKRAALVVVHGGGKEIDAALGTAGIAKHQVDGLRVTDAPTLALEAGCFGLVGLCFPCALLSAIVVAGSSITSAG
jgi:acetylglutamate kinase